RTAFQLEEVQLRTSSKTGKKFAILAINDGLERFELPVWPEHYETYRPLLVANQMLYAVLHVDKREEPLRLSCHWLGDLRHANERTIEECDQAYDRAKKQVVRQASYQNRPKAAAPPPPATSPVVQATAAPKAPDKLRLRVDLESVRLSHIA